MIRPPGNSLCLLIFLFSALYLLCLQVCFVGERKESGMLGDDDREKGVNRVRKKRRDIKCGKILHSDLN